MASEIIDIVLPVALQEVFEDIAPIFTTKTGHRFNVALMLNPQVPDHVAGGAQWSIALSNPVYIQKIVNWGGCDAGGVAGLGHSPLCFAVRGASGVPLGQSPSEIAAFLCAADSIAITETGTSGAQFGKLAADLGVTDQMQEKLRLLPGGGPMRALQSGDVEVAALPLTNVAAVQGVFAKCICPPQMEVHIDLAFCISAQANAAAHEFAQWICHANQRGRLQALGLRDLGAVQ